MFVILASLVGDNKMVGIKLDRVHGKLGLAVPPAEGEIVRE